MTDQPDLGRTIWGLPHIAQVMGVSEATVRRWAKIPGVPIYRPSGQGSYVAFMGELRAWLRTKAEP